MEKKYHWYWFKSPKHTIFVSNDCIWWEKFILHVFLALKLMKKYIRTRINFWIRVDFGSWGGFLGFMMSYIGLSWFLRYFIGVLCQKYVKNGFLGKNKPDFSITTTTKILANQWHFVRFFFQKNTGWTT